MVLFEIPFAVFMKHQQQLRRNPRTVSAEVAGTRVMRCFRKRAEETAPMRGRKRMRFLRECSDGKNCIYGDVAVSVNAVRKRRYIQSGCQQRCLPSRESCRTRHQLPYTIVRAIDSDPLILRMSDPLILPTIVAVLVSCATEKTELHSGGWIRFIETIKEVFPCYNCYKGNGRRENHSTTIYCVCV